MDINPSPNPNQTNQTPLPYLPIFKHPRQAGPSTCRPSTPIARTAPLRWSLVPSSIFAGSGCIVASLSASFGGTFLRFSIYIHE